MGDLHNRRVFLRAAAAAGATWTIADLGHVEDALAWASRTADEKTPSQLAVLTRHEGEVIGSAAARILPSVDGRAGAREAGVIYFIDRSLFTFNVAQRELYSRGVADLDARAAGNSKAGQTFVTLTPERQDEVLREIEHTRFFEALRFDTIAGTFALPSWGGNRDYAGWHLLGMTHQARFDPPFGYYDAEVNKGK